MDNIFRSIHAGIQPVVITIAAIVLIIMWVSCSVEVCRRPQHASLGVFVGAVAPLVFFLCWLVGQFQ